MFNNEYLLKMNQETSGYGYNERMLSFIRNAALYSALTIAPFMFGCSNPTMYEGKVQGDITGRSIGKKDTKVRVTIDNVVQGANESGLKPGETITVNYLTSTLQKDVLDSLKKCNRYEHWVFGDEQKCKGESTFRGVVGKRTNEYQGKDLVVVVYSAPKKPNESLESIKRGAIDAVGGIYEGSQKALEKGKEQLEEIDREYRLKETGKAVLEKGERALEQGKEKLEEFEERHKIGQRAMEKAKKLKEDTKQGLKDLLRKLRE